ncbi:MAG: sugar ABC transporter permease [Ruminococcus sp.]|jgi:multiple sugar transport system permease protein|nr:sugar ABC transporter permease [Ruminococcus sp.]
MAKEKSGNSSSAQGAGVAVKEAKKSANNLSIPLDPITAAELLERQAAAKTPSEKAIIAATTVSDAPIGGVAEDAKIIRLQATPPGAQTGKIILNKAERKYSFKEYMQYQWHEAKRSGMCYLMLAPFMLLFLVFTVIPVIMSLPMGFTSFDMAEFPPKWVGFDNFYTLFLEDDVFSQAVRTTIIFAIFTGPLSYILSFFLAWLINELHPKLKTLFTLIFYAPSMAGNIYFVWQLIFSGDAYGYLNSFLNTMGFTTAAIQWLTDANYILPCVIIVQLWVSMGAGFLAIRAGFQAIDPAMYEAGAIEGIRNRWQELIYITIPSMGPQLMFAAVMQIVASFTVDIVGRSLVGFPSTNYMAHTIMTHAFDYGWVRFEMGYASAICFVLFVAMLIANSLVRKILSRYLDN